MQRARAAERHQHAAPRIAAALDRDQAHGVLHVLGRDQVRAPRRLAEIEAERLAEVRGDGRFGRGAVEAAWRRR